jgi:glycosyltransferase involved in cell wall biosynthesis
MSSLQTKEKTIRPLVSILIPVYNGTEYLDEAIQSVLRSTYKNIEIILVDDGSTDLSRHKIKEYQKQHKNIRFFGFAKNKGMTRCLNFGIRKAKGKYIARFNQDDIMRPKRLEQQVKFLESHTDYVIVGGKIRLFDDHSHTVDELEFPHTDEMIRSQWMMLSPYSDPTVMYRKSAWLKTEGYSQYFWPADDVHMWYQLGRMGKMANLRTVLTDVRWHKKCGSILTHHRQMVKTWQVHNWAAEFIAQPTLSQRSFWFGQLLAGYIFPAEFNWWVYRQMRKLEINLFAAKVKRTSHSVKQKLSLPKQFRFLSA